MTSSNKALVLIDPLTDWREVIKAALDLNYQIISLQMPDATPQVAKFLPSVDLLKNSGVSHTLSIEQRDVFSALQQLQILCGNYNIDIVGVIPLSEVAVELSDIISSALGLPHNPLNLLTARRDKGLMKLAVLSAGLKIAKFERIKTHEEISLAMEKLSLSYPVVVKTPAGMSTSDVFICHSKEEANTALQSILGKISPDGRMIGEALLEEYINGTEFAINIMAFKNDNDSKGENVGNTQEQSHLLVTDMWKYNKNQNARYSSAEICNPGEYPELVTYAVNVARAVGIEYGAAHVELKATRDEDGKYTNPTMMEVGARLSGGRKSIMAHEVIDGWNPFESLIQSHCGGGVCPVSEHYLTPNEFVRHIFLPIDQSGRVTKFELNESLETVHSAFRLVKVGDVVSKTTDIVSCAGFVWLVGDKEKVDMDAEELLSSFVLITEEDKEL